MSGELSDLPDFYVSLSVLFLFFSAFFNAVKFALSSLECSDENNGIALRKKTLSIIGIKIYIFLFNCMALVLSTIFFFYLFQKNLYFSHNNVISVMYLIFIVSVYMCVTSVFCEIIPERLVSKNQMDFLNKFSKIISIFVIPTRPIAMFILFLSKQILKLFGTSHTTTSELKDKAEENILDMIDKGSKSGVIENRVKDMVSGIFEFDDTIVSEIMTHRTEMTAIQDDKSLRDAVDLATQTGFSRIPVFREDMDDIIGIVYAKDLLKYVYTDVSTDIPLKNIMRPVIFIPKTKHLDELFADMRQSKTQIAIIVDEYGGTEGLVTIEDLIEEILGNIQDEYDIEEAEVKKVNETTLTIDGNMNIDEAADLLDISIPDGDYETISGFIIEKLGYIPCFGEHPKVSIGEFSFTVSGVEDRRISKIIVVKK